MVNGAHGPVEEQSKKVTVALLGHTQIVIHIGPPIVAADAGMAIIVTSQLIAKVGFDADAFARGLKFSTSCPPPVTEQSHKAWEVATVNLALAGILAARERKASEADAEEKHGVPT